MWNCLLMGFIYLMILIKLFFFYLFNITKIKSQDVFSSNKIEHILLLQKPRWMTFWYQRTITLALSWGKKNQSCETKCVKSYLNLQTLVRIAWDWRWSCSVGRTLPQGWGSLPAFSTPSGFQQIAEWQCHQTASPLFHLFVSVAKTWYM